jgi:hypothetical protein
VRYFTLHNLSRNIDLTHPVTGVWSTTDETEAKEMLDSCHEYLKAVGLEYMIDQIVLKESH